MTTPTTDAVRGLIDCKLGVLKELTGLPMVFGGAVERSGRTENLIISHLRGNRTAALNGLTVSSGQGLGGSSSSSRGPSW